MAIGASSTSTGGLSTALGPFASANFANSAAFGNGATATRANQQVFGTGSNTYTLPGLTSAASTAAQSGPLGLVTTDGAGNLASDGGSTFAGIAANGRDIRANRKDIRRNEEGIALALAMESPFVPLSQSSAIAAGFGVFRDSSAFALSGAFRVDDNVQFSAGLGVGLDHSSVGARVGVIFSW